MPDQFESSPINQPATGKSKPVSLFAALMPFIWGSLLLIGFLVFLLAYGRQAYRGLFGPLISNYDDLVVSNGYHTMSLSSGETWQITYEQNHDTVFSGVIRHLSVDRESRFPILSHDLLITQGDFANPSLVSTSVSNHHFTWKIISGGAPSGSINLLHIIPMDQAIYDQLAQLKVGDSVSIKGWEILKIDAYSADQSYLGYWTDSGCNSILVTEVIIN